MILDLPRGVAIAGLCGYAGAPLDMVGYGEPVPYDGMRSEDATFLTL